MVREVLDYGDFSFFVQNRYETFNKRGLAGIGPPVTWMTFMNPLFPGWRGRRECWFPCFYPGYPRRQVMVLLLLVSLWYRGISARRRVLGGYPGFLVQRRVREGHQALPFLWQARQVLRGLVWVVPGQVWEP